MPNLIELKPTIYRKDKLLATNWRGGTTTELFIYPPESSYAQRDFNFRISTATVESENSEFTPLPGVHRTLMVLDGKMELIHEGQHSARLNRYEIDQFEGDWKTTSAGKCNDFNLMCTGNFTGEIQQVILLKDDVLRYQTDNDLGSFMLYSYEGDLMIRLDEEEFQLHQGDVLVAPEVQFSSVIIKALSPSYSIITNVNR